MTYSDAVIETDIVVAMQEQLRQVGITCDLVPVTRTKFSAIRREGWGGLFWLAGGQEGGDVIRNWSVHLSYTREGMALISMKRPEQWDKLFKQLLTVKDRETIDKIMKEMSMVCYETEFAIPMFNRPDLHIMADGVHGYRDIGHYSWTVGEVWMEKKLQR